jgi:hypothetical protein
MDIFQAEFLEIHHVGSTSVPIFHKRGFTAYTLRTYLRKWRFKNTKLKVYTQINKCTSEVTDDSMVRIK